jgi:prepilin signal peptidase PulO-like enzyme (type II secretory pathway)
VAWLIAAFIVVVGSAVGWACAWLVHRYDEDPETVTAVLGDATCEHCDHVLLPLDTARAGGACPNCHERLPAGWFVTAAAVPIVGLCMLGAFGATLWLVPYLWLVPVLVVASAIDIRLMLIPKRVAWVGFGVGAVLLVATAAYHGVAGAAVVNMAMGVALYFGILFAMWFIAPRGMGFGDVRLAAVLGLYLGFIDWRLAMIGLFIACVAGVVLGVGVRILRSDGNKHFPFGPGLALGAVVALCFYQPLLDMVTAKA